ncbi:MAG: PrpF domain-containing protein [SAR324 cluster bacterium]|nr:PrpF domain-containing protein [SAR324 cluster bacterium]
MPIKRIPAVFMRGGTSKAVVFHARDLPESQAERDAIFLRVLGSPDPNQRQLDGLGGGLSSLSKVVIVAPSRRPGVDVDYTFAQVAVDRPVVDYSSMCGNMSASVGPFAVDEGLVEGADGEATVRIYNTNTDKVFHARFAVQDRAAVEVGDFRIPGVSGSGARITLDYHDPGGAATSGFLPSGKVCDSLDVPGLGEIEVSFVDATNPVVFVRASDLGCTGGESPEVLETDALLLQRLDAIRRLGAVRMGLAETPESASLANPKVAMVGPAAEFTSLDGIHHRPETHDLVVRMVSMERIHRAITLTGAMCTAAAVGVNGSIPNEFADSCVPLRIGSPSGVLPVEAEVRDEGNGRFTAVSVTCYRTQRRLMEGKVLVPVTL